MTPRRVVAAAPLRCCSRHFRRAPPKLRPPQPETKTDTYELLNLFGDVFERVRADYVEQASDEQLIEAAINGMLSSLDPHSGYMNAKRFDDMKVQTQGAFGGLGIEVTMEGGLVKVVSPIDDTPAFKAGIQPGDLITHIDGEAVLGMSLPDAVDKMRGPAGSEHPPDHPPRRSRTLRRHAHPLGDQDQVGALAPRRQGRLHPHQLVQRADGCRSARRDRRAEEAGQRPAAGDRPRSAQQPRRLADAGCGGRRRFPRTRARSSRPARASRRTRSASTPSPATWPAACRSSF